MLNLILLGDPASGKATQAKRLLKKYSLFDLDMGRELRMLRLKKTAAVKKVFADTLDKGKLTPTQFVREIFVKTITNIKPSKGILFDGTPKMVGEARLVYKLLEQSGRSSNSVLVIYMNIPKKEIVKRMLDREIFLNGKRVKRSDDNIMSLQNRIKYYQLNIVQVLKFFKGKYTFKNVSGLGNRNEVNQKINRIINEFINKK